ncbi:MAG: hypothetical protein ACTSRE_13240 [Promethearchaeota archaeon]
MIFEEFAKRKERAQIFFICREESQFRTYRYVLDIDELTFEEFNTLLSDFSTEVKKIKPDKVIPFLNSSRQNKSIAKSMEDQEEQGLKSFLKNLALQ